MSTLKASTYYFWRVGAKISGNWQPFSPTRIFKTGTITSISSENGIVKEFRLEQNYPNQFNPITTIQYQLPVHSKAILKIFNVLGQQVARLVDDFENAGHKTVQWNSRNGRGLSVASGLYFYRLYATGVSAYGGEATSTSDPIKSFSQVRKMLLMK